MPLEEDLPIPGKRCVLVCQHTSCLRAGSSMILDKFEQSELPEDVMIIPSSCQGQCSTSPTVRIIPEETWYYRVQPKDVSQIVDQHLKGGKRVEEKLHPRIHPRFKFEYPE